MEGASTTSGSTAVENTQNEGAEAEGKDGEKKEAGEEGKDKATESAEKPPELPIEVRSKLRRLDKIESRYNGMNLYTCHTFPTGLTMW